MLRTDVLFGIQGPLHYFLRTSRIRKMVLLVRAT